MERAWLDPEAACSGLSFPLVDLPPVATASAEATIRFLVGYARHTDILTGVSAEAALQSALRREQLAPTAVGRGLALPHAKVEELPRLAGILGHSAAGVSWPSPDGEPVVLACLLLLWPRGGEGVRFREAAWGYFRGQGHPGLACLISLWNYDQVREGRFLVGDMGHLHKIFMLHQLIGRLRYKRQSTHSWLRRIDFANPSPL
jgi:hypothetical protein